MEGYSIGRQNGWLSANDIRELENMNPISEEEGGNLYLINGAMTKVKDAGAFAGKENLNGEETKESKEPAQTQEQDSEEQPVKKRRNGR